jgi:hypothetical protein
MSQFEQVVPVAHMNVPVSYSQQMPLSAHGLPPGRKGLPLLAQQASGSEWTGEQALHEVHVLAFVVGSLQHTESSPLVMLQISFKVHSSLPAPRIAGVEVGATGIEDGGGTTMLGEGVGEGEGVGSHFTLPSFGAISKAMTSKPPKSLTTARGWEHEVSIVSSCSIVPPRVEMVTNVSSGNFLPPFDVTNVLPIDTSSE